VDSDGWKRGLPKGKVTHEMLETYEVYYSPIGVVWHRKKPLKPEAASRDL